MSARSFGLPVTRKCRGFYDNIASAVMLRRYRYARTACDLALGHYALCERQIEVDFPPYVIDQPTSNQQPATSLRLFRPPFGRITRRQIKSLSEYKIVMWDVLTHDYAKSLSPDRCLKGSIVATRPGSVIVFHDSLKAERNMTYVLPRFIEHFANLGYTFKSLG